MRAVRADPSCTEKFAATSSKLGMDRSSFAVAVGLTIAGVLGHAGCVGSAGSTGDGSGNGGAGATGAHPGATGGASPAPGTGGGAGRDATGGRTVAGGSGGAPGGGSGTNPGGSGGQVGSGGGAAGGRAGSGSASGGRPGTGGNQSGTGGTTGTGGLSVGAGGSAGVRGAAGAPGTAGASGTGDLLAPAQGALLGLYYGAGTIAATDARIGRSPQIHLTYFAWSDAWENDARSDLAAGRIPLVNWEPDGIDFADIANGKLDANIKARAQGAKGLGKKFFLDFAAEMNGDEGWSNNDATLYISAYRHIHDLFVAAGATNVVWVWAPNVTDTNGRNDMTLAYYPGDDYVDWTGVDGYNWGGADWQTFETVFKDIYPLLAAKKKPIMIGEMASAEPGGDKAAWIDAIIPSLKGHYPMFKALVWFDVNKENDWRINSSMTALTAFGRLATDPYFNP